MWIGDARRHGLGEGPRHHELEEVPGGLGVVRGWRSNGGQLGLDGFVNDEVDHRLRDAEVGRRHTFVKALEALQQTQEHDAVTNTVGPSDLHLPVCHFRNCNTHP